MQGGSAGAISWNAYPKQLKDIILWNNLGILGLKKYKFKTCKGGVQEPWAEILKAAEGYYFMKQSRHLGVKEIQIQDMYGGSAGAMSWNIQSSWRILFYETI
jgi:hypothetical protein